MLSDPIPLPHLLAVSIENSSVAKGYRALYYQARQRFGRNSSVVLVMPQDPHAQCADAERAELGRVVEALAKAPRLSRLLQFMGEKLASGEVDQLNEYNIATEVFGRSKTVFNAADDAIARVETHRLRRRLAAFYETEGREHPVQVTLPAGSYVPVFIHKPAHDPTLVSPDPGDDESSYRNNDRALQWWIGWRWKFVAVAASIALAFGAYFYFRHGSAPTLSKSEDGSPLTSASISPSVDGSLPIRLLAGYSGPPRTDSAGRVWYPDRYFSGGGNWRRDPGPIARARDPFLFEHSRTGDFSYTIPLKPGFYELHLFFSTPVRVGEGISTFSVSLNGENILRAFDINADALGENVADERVFRGVSPDKDGFLRLIFSGETGPPSLNALEILPGLPRTQLPVRLIMQTTPFTDRYGQVWAPDDYFMNGRLSNQTHPMLNSEEPDLFSRERFGHFTYAIPVDTQGRYTLVLHFAEFYFGAGASGNGGVGSRLFKVMCNGETLLDNFDIFKEAGTFHEITKTFRHLKPSAQGKLNLTFEPIANNATISGIEVLDESK